MPRENDGFSVVEAVVATSLLGVAGAGLAAALAVSGAIRQRADAEARAAAGVAERVAVLAHRPCTATDTAGVAAADALIDRWVARRVPSGWSYADTISSVRAGALAAAGGVVACAP